MSGPVKDLMRRLALRVYKDPTSANVDDARKMARAILLLVDGKLP
jgi:hypothetical protein